MPEIFENPVDDLQPSELDLPTSPLLRSREGLRSLAPGGLFALGCFYTLYFARDFFIPVVLAVFFSFLLGPVVRILHRIRVPLMVGSGIVMVGCFALVGGVFFELSAPISDWLDRVPAITSKLEREFQQFRRPVEKVTQATEQVQKIANGPPNSKPPQQVELKKPSLLTGFVSKTYSIVFSFIEFAVLLFFLLGSGDLFLRKVIHVLPRLEDKKRAVQIAREIEDNISHYLLTVAGINICLGTAASVVFVVLGMPNPLLWGALGCVLNFVPYLGALITIGITSIVGIATFPNVGHAILIPASYLALATVEGSLITPWIVGRRMTLNPVVIFLGLTFWGFMWGIIGTLLAVPLLVMFKILCDHIEPLSPIGEFLGG